MKTLMIVALSMLTTAAFAQDITCLDKLMPSSRFSGLHQLTKEEWAESAEILLDADSSKLAIKALTESKLFCKSTEIAIKMEPVCAYTIQDIPQSLTCFVFTNLGYFTISKDNGKNTNFIFSKDKKFNESQSNYSF